MNARFAHTRPLVRLIALLPCLILPPPAIAEIPAGNLWPNPSFEEGAEIDQPTGTLTAWNRGGNAAQICEVTTAFRVTALFLGPTGVVGEHDFDVTGQSTGWTGTLAGSTWIKRREFLGVPAGALTLRLALVSAGPPAGTQFFRVRKTD